MSLSGESGFDANEIAGSLRGYGVLAGVTSLDRMRLVTHYGITDDDIKTAIKAFERVLAR